MSLDQNAQKIPQVIHYCWFGGKPLSATALKYVNTWKKQFPDYELILWNEENFPMDEFPYAKDAYAKGKMAFVSDVARVYALFHHGGVYFDTDVEVLRDMRPLLQGKKMVLGCERVGKNVGTGFIAALPHHAVIQAMLEYYQTHSFEKQSTPKPNTQILAEVLRDMYGIEPLNECQEISDLIMYPQEYFTACNQRTEMTQITKNTYCVHRFQGSWESPLVRFKKRIRQFVKKIKVKLGLLK